ncbi:MAG: aminotransferase class I/II-fold pyridoxal phosphate-dependent enzyme [Clostridia bacterium]|nr:aminotransferase class I/II-fold pyridoxal phosphate-dependent enzyme [Clostridia bacterium]
MRLYDALAAYSKTDAVPMHMPGHKRYAYDYLVGAELDITEIDGFDDLHDAEGLLQEAMDNAARVWGSRRAYFCVNGSTGGILAAIHACAPRGKKILVAQNCHKSVWHAIELCRLMPLHISPPVENDFDIFASIDPQVVDDALDINKNIAAVVITSPTYEGVISDIAAICAAAHRHGVPVIVDEAHGAHLGFSPFPDGAVRAGADIVVQSLHKTLPSLTQTAIVHLCGDLIDPAAFLRSKNLFETSSPSYLLMASCDGCARLLGGDDPTPLDGWANVLDIFYARTAALRHLRIFRPTGRAAVFAHDPSKIVISTRGTSITGGELMDRLREKFGIELEMASGDYALAMTGHGTTREHICRLADALRAIDGTLTSADVPAPILLPPPAEQVMRPADAVEAPKLTLPVERTEGEIAADYLWAYPPGIPLLAPGQRIDRAVLDTIAALRERGVHLRETIDVVEEHW